MPGVRLTVVGCGDAFGSGGRLHTCFALQHRGRTALVDCGATALAGLDRLGLSADRIDAVFITHLHGDHFGGVPFLLLDAAYNRVRQAPLTIAGPPGVRDHVLDTLELLYPGTRERVTGRVPFECIELPARTRVAVGEAAVTAIPVVHGSSLARGLRVETGGVTVAFSGDTEWTPALVELAQDAELFVCECTGWDTPPPSHLSHATLREHAGELAARRLLLTHLGPSMLAHAARADWPCAEDGMVIDI